MDVPIEDIVAPLISDNAANNSLTERFNRIEGGEQQVIVACRIRPLTEDEIMQGSSMIAHKVADDNMIVLMDPSEDADDILRANRSRERQFIFNMVFDAKSTQQDVFEKTTKVLLNGVLNGYNATVFAYGATGAGKTFTMLGTQEEPGIMFRTLHDLFIEISKQSSDLMYQVSMSYMEIYNELIRDLLNPSAGFLELREDAKGGVQIAGISERVAETPQEVMYMLHKGNKERTQEPTKANKTSSRSHAVLQVNIKQRNRTRQHTQEVRLGKLYMIDLAGSERAAQTQNTGKRMVEGAHINRSLLALGNCINALSEKGSTKYVNYRDSKLTRILKDALGGNSKTVMIAHVSPASIHFEESRNTLVYADRAKYIRTKLRRNVIDVSYHISQYQQIIQELAQEIANLKDQRSDLESRISHLDPRNNISSNEDKVRLEESLKLRESLIQTFKEHVRLRKNILELDNSIMDLAIESDRLNKTIDKWEAQKENHTKIPESVKKEEHSKYVNAKEEIKVVEHDREDLEAKQKSSIREYEQVQAKVRKLRDQITKKLSTKEQKEILSLLCKNFEFEMKALESQSDIFKRDFKIREQDMVILRLEQHRSLCDTLIYQQRKLIKDHKISMPKDLDELFYLYSRDVNEGQLMKDLSTGAASNNRAYMNIQSQKLSQNTNTFLTQIQEEPGLDDSLLTDTKFTAPWSKRSLAQTLDRADSDSNKLFYKTNKAPSNNHKSKVLSNSNSHNSNFQNNSNGHSTVIPHFAFNDDNRHNLSLHSSSTNDSNFDVLYENIAAKLANDAMRASTNQNGQKSKNKPLKRDTQGIAAVAAQRKASQHHKELMQELAGTNEALRSDPLTASRLAKHDQLTNAHVPHKPEETMSDKRSSILTDGSNRTAKKQVKIRDSVLFEEYESNGAAMGHRRRNSDSPLLNKKFHDEQQEVLNSSFNTAHNNKSTPNNKTSRRSKSINNTNLAGNQQSNANAKSNTNARDKNTLNANVHQTPATKVAPSIPGYSKGNNMSISGTSVLKL